MMTVALTGGMGCGKSTAAACFVKAGFRSLDADAIVHELLAGDRDVQKAIVERFGPDMLNGRGGIDRRKLGTRVFADTELLQWLEGWLHPRVRAYWQRALAEEPDFPWVIQIPLLFEKKLEQFFDFTVCVGTSGDTQRRRLRQRGLTDHELTQRISRQLPIEEKTERADFFLLNDGSLAFLREQVQCLCDQLIRRE